MDLTGNPFQEMQQRLLTQQQQEMLEGTDGTQSSEALCHTATRVLDGLPRLLSMGKQLPGPMSMISGMVQGLAQQHIGKYPEEELQILLQYVEGEIHYWRTGDGRPE